ncbi:MULTISPECIES: beta/alpha barrel domain-containing protein [Helcococcus]|uniref:NADH:flavin oxidoreductase/NADH oxidase N-terminal domain-containing protein n=1 Tax=Helcococcus bovis TaxID=3153252 RepID=A0ABW9F3W3_9FIRM
MSPEEIHSTTPGYLYQSSLQLIKEISKYDLDYIHLSLNEYNQTPYNKGEQRPYAELFKNILDDNTKLIITGNINDKNSLNDALIHANLVALGRQSLIYPLFTKKILENREDEIIREISPSQLINTK